MNNIENSSRSLKIKEERSPVGLQPSYISPKEFNDLNSIKEFSESHSTFEQKQPIIKSVHSTKKVVFNQIKIETNSPDNQEQLHSTITPIIYMIVWLMYVIGSTQPFPYPLSIYHFIDLLGIAIGLILTFNNLRESIFNFNLIDCFQFYSIGTTIAYYFYGEGYFIYYLNFIRALRLLYPMLLVGSLSEGLGAIRCIIIKTYRTIFSVIIILVIISIITIYLFQGSTYFRCRPTSIPTKYYWPAMTSQLCGTTQCPPNTYCRSPKQFSMEPLQKQLVYQKQLLYGKINYNEIVNSLTSNMMVMGNINWAEVTSMYFNHFNILIVIIVFGSLVLLYKLASVVIVMDLFDHQRKEAERKLISYKEIQSMKQSLGTDEVSLQPINQNQIGIQTVSGFKRQYKLVLKNIREKYPQFLKNLVFMLHVILVTNFGWKSQAYSQVVGMTLSVLFILWSVYLACLITNFMNDSQKTSKYQIIFQLTLYISTIVDYVVRIVQGLYIFGQPGAFTPFNNAIVCLRVFYVCRYFQFLPFLEQFTDIVIKVFFSTVKFFPMILGIATLPAMASFYSLQLSNGNDTSMIAVKQFTNSLVLILNFSWLELISMNYLTTVQNWMYILAIAIGQLVLVRYIFSTIFLSNLPAISYNPPPPPTNLPNQKSFYIFSIDNSFRKLCNNIIQAQIYNNIRLYYIIFYCAFMFIGFEFMSQQSFRISRILLDVIFLVDMLVEMVGKGVLGQISYTQNKPVRFINIFSTFYIGINLFVPLFPFLLRACQFCRVFLLCQYLNPPKIFADRLSPAGKMIGGYVIIVIALVNMYMSLYVIPSSKYHNRQHHQLARDMIKSLSITLSERGWDWALIFSPVDPYMVAFTKLGVVLLSITLEVGVKYTLAMYLYMSYKRTQQYLDENKYQTTDQQKIQKQKIKQFILSIKCQKDHNALLTNKGFLYKFITSPQYSYTLIAFQIFSLLSLCLITSFTSFKWKYMAVECSLIGLMGEIILTALELSVFRLSKPYIWFDLVSLIVSIPGCFLIFVDPLYYSVDHHDLKQFLLVLCALSAARLLKLGRLIRSINNLANKAFKILMSLRGVLFFAVSFTLIFALIFQDRFKDEKQFRKIFFSINAAIIGLSGGGLSSLLFSADQEIIEGWKMTIYFCCCAFSLLLRNFFLAEIIYAINSSQTTEFAIFTKKMEGFQQKWKFFDPKAEGVANPKSILYFSKRLMPYVSFPKNIAQTYQGRYLLFRSLQIPIYEVQQIQNNTKNTKYVILLCDALYFLYHFSKFKQIKSNHYIKQQQLHDWSSKSIVEASKNLKIFRTNLNTKNISKAINLIPRIKHFKKIIKSKQNSKHP